MMWNGAWFWLGPCLLLMVVCAVIMMRMMGHGTHGTHGPLQGTPGGRRAGEAEQILADRLARGDIDIEQYERRLETLQRTREQRKE